MPHIAHEVRAQVRKGLTSAQLLQRQESAAGESAARHLQAIIESQTTLNRFLTRLTTLLNASSQRHPPSSPNLKIPLKGAILGAKLDCREALRDAGAEMVIGEIPAALVPQRVQTVMAELIDNSVRYRHPERSPRVTVTSTEQSGRIEVQVVDNGMGIPAPYDENLFQPFLRLDPERSGFGLGLTISRVILENAGGGIQYMRPDSGAIFVFQLPAGNAAGK